MKRLLTAFTVAAFAGAASAQTPAPSPPTTSVAPVQVTAGKDDPNKVTCKSQQKTGSRFYERVCHTNAEWTQIATDSKASMQYMQQKANSYSVGH